MKKLLLFVLVMLLSPAMFSQVNLTDSNLPIVLINTDTDQWGQPMTIPDDPKIGADMKVIWHPDGSRNYVSDQNTSAFLSYDGRIAIETRGSTSQGLAKKPYSLVTKMPDNVTDTNVSIVQLPKEHDWILNAFAYDPSHMRDPLSYQLSEDLGQYATRGFFCEVVLNGSYVGLYYFMERIKVDKNRVDIRKLATTDLAGTQLTGGYITKSDKTTGGDPVAWQMSSYNGTTDFLHHFPKQDMIQPAQDTYIHSYFQSLETAAGTNNTSTVNGWQTLIDIPTFVDFMLINELASNADAYQFSTFFHKDIKGKLRAGPAWDFNLTFGNDLFFWGYDRSHYNVWQFDNGDNTGAKFWKDLYDSPEFHCYLAKRWNELTAAGQPLNYSVISAKIDQMKALIQEAKARENLQWSNMPSWNTEITTMKTWVQNRINWMTNQLSSFSACSNVTVPPLVISKIHYNPVAGMASSDDQEFIEITNHSATSSNVGGIYFRELGISYTFPQGATLLPNEVIFLAADPVVFQQTYGFTAYGTFERNLSNNSQHLVLADMWGNIVDDVEYQDIAPWPNADGNGYYLQLAGLDLDNSLAQSWIAGNNVAELHGAGGENVAFELFPNPANSTLFIDLPKAGATSVQIVSVVGEIVSESSANQGGLLKMDISNLAPDSYFVHVKTEDGSQSVKKLIIVR